VIELPRDHYEEIVSQAREELPNEACGLVAGRNGYALKVIRMRNADRSALTYRFDPAEQLRVMDRLDEEGLDIVAIYHSHTHTEAFLSPTDRARAHWRDPESGEMVPLFPGVHYLLVSLMDEEAPVLRGFRFEGGEPVEEEVAIR
jgi:[CysO sulfur-carrier protein]-S-L-cysteine hydrolase